MDARTAFAAARSAFPTYKIRDFTTIQDGPHVLGWVFRTDGRRAGGVRFGWVLADGRVSDVLNRFEHDAEADGRHAAKVPEQPAA